jgi:Beta-lactamase superfamily domain
MAFRMEKLRQLWKLVRESHAEPLKGEPRKPAAVGVEEQAITFIGHSSFLVQMTGLGVLIDPVFATRLILLRRQRRAGVRVKDLPAIDAVLLTHAHMDHLNRPSLRAVVKEMRRRGRVAPVAVVPNGVEDLVTDLGFSKVVELKWWESAEVEGQKMTATPARHWGARMFSDTHRGFGGYVLEAEGAETVYHSGDTAYFGAEDCAAADWGVFAGQLSECAYESGRGSAGVSGCGRRDDGADALQHIQAGKRADGRTAGAVAEGCSGYWSDGESAGAGRGGAVAGGRGSGGGRARAGQG